MKLNAIKYWMKVIAGSFVLLLAFFYSSNAHKSREDKDVHKKYAPTSGLLYHEIAHLDVLQFAAFNSKNIDQLKLFFDSTLELYQDNVGFRNYRETVKAFTNLFKMKYVLTRKLVLGSMEVYPIKGFGAIQTGRHTFSHIENGQLQKATFKFMQIWQKKEGI
ncbi:MAG: hypothetical protein NVS9B7_21190 [Flavisolibacter sp.]